MKMIKIKQYIAGILVMNIFANVALPANAFAAQTYNVKDNCTGYKIL